MTFGEIQSNEKFYEIYYGVLLKFKKIDAEHACVIPNRGQSHLPFKRQAGDVVMTEKEATEWLREKARADLNGDEGIVNVELIDI